MIESWSAMSAWVASKWEEIPTQEREKLQRFAVQVVDPEANVWLGKSTAVQVAMMLLALKVAQKMFPHWDELWRRLTGIVKDWQTSDPGNTLLSAQCTSVTDATYGAARAAGRTGHDRSNRNVLLESFRREPPDRLSSPPHSRFQ